MGVHVVQSHEQSYNCDISVSYLIVQYITTSPSSGHTWPGLCVVV